MNYRGPGDPIILEIYIVVWHSYSGTFPPRSPQLTPHTHCDTHTLAHSRQTHTHTHTLTRARAHEPAHAHTLTHTHTQLTNFGKILQNHTSDMKLNAMAQDHTPWPAFPSCDPPAPWSILRLWQIFMVCSTLRPKVAQTVKLGQMDHTREQTTAATRLSKIN